MKGISSHDINNLYLEKIFTIASQFGDVPIIICGDFQDDPDTFPSVQHAKHCEQWSDPLSKHSDDGTSCRPITYSRDSNFVDPTDNFSSIDGFCSFVLPCQPFHLLRCCIQKLVNIARSEQPLNGNVSFKRVIPWLSLQC